jgi:hypothetical protein
VFPNLTAAGCAWCRISRQLSQGAPDFGTGVIFSSLCVPPPPDCCQQAVAALKKRIDVVSADFGCNVAVRTVEWHSRMHRVRGWEREISRVSLPSIPELRQGIKDVLGDCFLLLSERWRDLLLAEVVAFGSFLMLLNPNIAGFPSSK